MQGHIIPYTVSGLFAKEGCRKKLICFSPNSLEQLQGRALMRGIRMCFSRRLVLWTCSVHVGFHTVAAKCRITGFPVHRARGFGFDWTESSV